MYNLLILSTVGNNNANRIGHSTLHDDLCMFSQPATFLSAILLVTATMLRLGLPTVNILSKVDLLKFYGPLPFGMDYFTELPDLLPLLRSGVHPGNRPIAYDELF